MLISGKIIINSSSQTNEQIKTKINLWNRRYLYNIHCSLRYQGNFIVNTLDQMVQYISSLQNNKILNNKFPGNILHQDLTIKGQTRSILNNSQPKFILFTNIRLDFSIDGNVNPDKVTQNTNIKDAYIHSIDFANKINPLTGKMASCNFGVTLFGKRKHHFGKQIKKKKSKKGKNHLSKRSIKHSEKQIKKKKLKKHIKFLKSLH